jgi:hypothetical protein
MPPDSAIAESPSRLSIARAIMFARLGKPDALATMPATIEQRPAAEVGRPMRYALGGAVVSTAALLFGAFVGDRLYWIAEDSVADNLAHLLDLAWSRWVLLPGACLLAAVLLHALRRRRPEWVRVSLSREEVRVEGPAGSWTTPVAAFSGLALRRRDGRTYLMTQQHSSNMRQLGLHGPSRPMVRREALWWIELVHPDPQRSVPIWASASDHAGDAARRAARSFAARLDLPVLR